MKTATNHGGAVPLPALPERPRVAFTWPGALGSDVAGALVFDTVANHLGLLAQSRARFLDRLCQTFADVSGLPASECEVVEQRTTNGVGGQLLTYTVQRRRRPREVPVPRPYTRRELVNELKTLRTLYGRAWVPGMENPPKPILSATLEDGTE